MFVFFVKFADFKICDVIIDIIEVTLMLIFFLILNTIKMKFDQILMFCMTDISNIFLTQCWKLETSSRPSYDVIKMTI